MSQWNHVICAECWVDQHHDGRQPVEAIGGDIEHCCWCGRHTAQGILVREDAAKIPNHVEHHPGRD